MENKKIYDEGAIILPSKDESAKKNEKSKEPMPPSLKPYMPPLPFPQRFVKAKLDSPSVKFLDVLKKLHVNIPFIDSLSQIPLYAKFLKEFLSKEGKI